MTRTSASPAGGRSGAVVPTGVAGRLFGWVGAPMAWLVQLGVVWFIQESVCVHDRWPATLLGVSVLALVTVAVTVALAAAALAAGTVALRSRRWALRTARERGGAGPDLAQTASMGQVGVLLAGISLAAIVLSGLSPFFLPPCST